MFAVIAQQLGPAPQPPHAHVATIARLPMSVLLCRASPVPALASTRAPTEGRWPPGKTCSLMKSLLRRYASYRSSGSQIACSSLAEGAAGLSLHSRHGAASLSLGWVPQGVGGRAGSLAAAARLWIYHSIARGPSQCSRRSSPRTSKRQRTTKSHLDDSCAAGLEQAANGLHVGWQVVVAHGLHHLAADHLRSTAAWAGTSMPGGGQWRFLDYLAGSVSCCRSAPPCTQHPTLQQA